MNSGWKHHVRHAGLPALAAALALGLGACNQEPSSGTLARDIDRAMDEGARGWEQATNIADDKLDRTPGATRANATTAGKASEDVALSAKVKSALSAEPGLKALAIDVNAVNGAVTLYGTADSPGRRDKAAHVALNVDGVKSVTNHLIILKGS